MVNFWTTQPQSKVRFGNVSIASTRCLSAVLFLSLSLSLSLSLPLPLFSLSLCPAIDNLISTWLSISRVFLGMIFFSSRRKYCFFHLSLNLNLRWKNQTILILRLRTLIYYSTLRPIGFLSVVCYLNCHSFQSFSSCQYPRFASHACCCFINPVSKGFRDFMIRFLIKPSCIRYLMG